MSDWRFALAPSLGKEPVRTRARQFASLLYEIGFSTVWPQESYAALEERLLSGEAHAAWGPPLICARVEAAGGAVALRGIRYGAATYRSVILCRAEDKIELSNLGRMRRRPRAVWVDESSMAGYLLPRSHLRSLGVEPRGAFFDERLLGSYDACLKAILDGEADLTACYAPAASANRPAAGYVELCGFRAIELRVLAYTSECPNDGLVLSPRLEGGLYDTMRSALRRLVADPASRRALADAFEVDGFDEPPAASYQPLLRLQP